MKYASASDSWNFQVFPKRECSENWIIPNSLLVFVEVLELSCCLFDNELLIMHNLWLMRLRVVLVLVTLSFFQSCIFSRTNFLLFLLFIWRPWTYLEAYVYVKSKRSFPLNCCRCRRTTSTLGGIDYLKLNKSDIYYLLDDLLFLNK